MRVAGWAYFPFFSCFHLARESYRRTNVYNFSYEQNNYILFALLTANFCYLFYTHTLVLTNFGILNLFSLVCIDFALTLLLFYFFLLVLVIRIAQLYRYVGFNDCAFEALWCTKCRNGWRNVGAAIPSTGQRVVSAESLHIACAHLPMMFEIKQRRAGLEIIGLMENFTSYISTFWEAAVHVHITHTHTYSLTLFIWNLHGTAQKFKINND